MHKYNAKTAENAREKPWVFTAQHTSFCDFVFQGKAIWEVAVRAPGFGVALE